MDRHEIKIETETGYSTVMDKYMLKADSKIIKMTMGTRDKVKETYLVRGLQNIGSSFNSISG